MHDASPTSSPDAPDAETGRGGLSGSLEVEVTTLGRELGDAVGDVLGRVPATGQGPQALARTLGVDKVLTSRVLKAMRSRDPMAIVHHLPGPDPMRRLLMAARGSGVPAAVVERAVAAVDRLDALVRTEVGDRSGFDAILSAWLPEARREFELRRKQSAFKAMSQLKGVEARLGLSTVILSPCDEGRRIDIVWVIGHFGLHRLRPNATARVGTIRIDDPTGGRRPLTLSGTPIERLEDAMLAAYCDNPPARVDIERTGETVHYTLSGDDFGPASMVDLVTVEVNRSEMPRFVPRGSGRYAHVFAGVSIPLRQLVFDVLVHDDVYPEREPRLFLYDTAIDGIASPNDRTRDVSRLDLLESIQSLGHGVGGLRFAGAPRYPDLLRHVFSTLAWDDRAFRAHRCAIDYPVYGSQVTVAFRAPEGDA